VLIDRFTEGELGGGPEGGAGVGAGVEEEGGGGKAVGEGVCCDAAF
jgi:hypothetical protein